MSFNTLLDNITLKQVTDENTVLEGCIHISVLCSDNGTEGDNIEIYKTDLGSGTGIILSAGLSVSLNSSQGAFLPSITISPTTGTATYQVIYK